MLMQRLGRVQTAMTLTDKAYDTFTPPAKSYYASTWERVDKARHDYMAQNDSKSPTGREFARTVVKQILKENPKGELWAG